MTLSWTKDGNEHCLLDDSAGMNECIVAVRKGRRSSFAECYQCAWTQRLDDFEELKQLAIDHAVDEHELKEPEKSCGAEVPPAPRLSVPPAKNELELALQRRRMAFLRLFGVVCPLERSGVSLLAQQDAEKLDAAIDEFVASQGELLKQRYYVDRDRLQAQRDTLPIGSGG